MSAPALPALSLIRTPPAVPNGVLAGSWLDERGEPFAAAFRVANGLSVLFPGVAAVHTAPSPLPWRLEVDPQASAELALSLYHRFGLPLLLQGHGASLLHAGAVLGARGVVALLGEPGVGKSTTAYGLARRGYPHWADDLVVVEPAGQGAVARGLPFRPLLFRHAAEALGVDPQLLAGAPLGHGLAPLAAVVVLQRSERSQPPLLERLPPTQALCELLAHTVLFEHGSGHDRTRAFQQLTTLVECVAAYTLHFSPDLAHVSRLLDTIDQELLTRRPTDAP
jgi:hypothetical protein